MNDARCTVPKCYKTKDNRRCMTPNPWIVFIRTHAGRKMSQSQRRAAYRAWLAPLHRVREESGQEVYRARLCLANKGFTVADERPVVRTSPLQDLRKKLQQKIRQRNDIYYDECDIPPGILTFMKQFVHYDALQDVRSLNPCQKIAKLFLGTVARQGESQHYTFQKHIGYGGTGFIFDCRYKKQEDRVIKLVVLGREGGPTKMEVPTQAPSTIHIVSRQVFEQETAMHLLFQKRLEDARTSFTVPRLFHHGVVQTTKTGPSTSVGILVMTPIVDVRGPDNLPSKYKWKQLARMQDQRVPKARMVEIALTLIRLQGLGLVHGDLHSDNISFQGPTHIFDFGRSFSREDVRFRDHETEWMLMCICDLLAPMASLTIGFPSTKTMVYNNLVGMANSYLEVICDYFERVIKATPTWARFDKANRSSKSLKNPRRVVLDAMKLVDPNLSNPLKLLDKRAMNVLEAPFFRDLDNPKKSKLGFLDLFG